MVAEVPKRGWGKGEAPSARERRKDLFSQRLWNIYYSEPYIRPLREGGMVSKVHEDKLCK